VMECAPDLHRREPAFGSSPVHMIRPGFTIHVRRAPARQKNCRIKADILLTACGGFRITEREIGETLRVTTQRSISKEAHIRAEGRIHRPLHSLHRVICRAPPHDPKKQAQNISTDRSFPHHVSPHRISV
jgi:hypothetical protein